EIPSAIILLTSLGFFFFSGSWMFSSLSEFMGGIFRDIGSFRIHDIATASTLSITILKNILSIILPFMLVIVVAGIVANIIQIGFLFSPEAFSPKLSKFNLIKGIKKLFSLKSLVELVKSLIKITIVGGTAYLTIEAQLKTIPTLMQMDIKDILTFIGMTSFKICLYVSMALIIMAVLDYSYQKYEHTKSLKMTKQEIKDENKQTEGDPQVKARIRSIQIEMSRRRMMESVPDADVVITNPTHLAIALKFDSEKMVAPKIVAKGAGKIAERIRDIAGDNHVPIVENKLLAQTLFKISEIGDYIPAELYQAVAEVLAYVYRLKGIRTGV
ncbi:MAG: flagellar biosynthesis protein FlhB, partial [Desulfobacterales bacterium]|nr:flagellar biosynthesis protein FlhB [Deltaproteobacteria bacterium]NNL41682.1 flagellar biosynthesis protein FlhB [Desulfobacterales bacterium]